MVSGQLPEAIGAESFLGQVQLKMGVLALLNRKSFFPDNYHHCNNPLFIAHWLTHPCTNQGPSLKVEMLESHSWMEELCPPLSTWRVKSHFSQQIDSKVELQLQRLSIYYQMCLTITNTNRLSQNHLLSTHLYLAQQVKCFFFFLR